MKNKKIIKKIKASTKKAGKKASKISKKPKNGGKSTASQQKKYKDEIKKNTKEVGRKGIELLKGGIKNSFKIGADITKVIEKDLGEIMNNTNNTEGEKDKNL